MASQESPRANTSNINNNNSKSSGSNANSTRKFDNVTIPVTVKVTPDHLFPPHWHTAGTGNPSNLSNLGDLDHLDVAHLGNLGNLDYLDDSGDLDGKNTVLHFYRGFGDSDDSDVIHRVASCRGCSQYFRALMDVGIGYLRRLPEVVERLEYPMNLNTREPFRGRIEYIGEFEVPLETMRHLQRFHEAVLCWQCEYRYNNQEGEDVPEYSNWLQFDDFVKAHKTRSEFEPRSVKSIAEWTQSSMGAYYTLFPVPTSNLQSTGDAASNQEISHLIAHNPEQWSQFVELAANEAQCLVHNMLVQKRLNRWLEELPKTDPTEDAARRRMLGAAAIKSFELNRSGETDADALVGQIVSKGYGGLLMMLDERYGDRYKCLDDVVEEAETKTRELGKPPLQSYYDYYKQKDDHCKELIDSWRADPSANSVLPALQLAGRMTCCQLLALNQQKETNSSSSIDGLHAHTQAIYLLPPLCRPIGRSKWLFAGLVAPPIIWRVSSALLAFEAQSFVDRLIEEYQDQSSLGTTVPLPDTASITVMLDAITPRMCGESFDNERLEMLGDSVLKFVCSRELHQLYPTRDEGFLTAARSEVITNMHLSKMCKDLNLTQYLRGHPMMRGDGFLQLQPPGFSRASDIAGLSLWNRRLLAATKDDRKQGAVLPASDNQQQQYMECTVKEKVLADLVESVLGAYYLRGGLPCAVAAIKALGAWPTFVQPRSDPLLVKTNGSNARKRHRLCEEDAALPVPETGLGLKPSLVVETLDCIANNRYSGETVDEPMASRRPVIKQFEDTKVIQQITAALGYTFIDTSLLYRALTHRSVTNQDSNERLEFLGDAVLDFAVVTLLFQQQPLATQGDLSLQKSNAVNNDNLGILGLKMGLYKHFMTFSSSLQDELNEMEKTLSKQCLGDADLLALHQATPSASKALADVLEALIGAAYLDSGESLDVVYQMIKHIDLLPQISY